MPIATAILALLQYAPAAIQEITTLYQAVKGDLSASDISQIDAALQAAKDADWASTQKADDALTDAAKR